MLLIKQKYNTCLHPLFLHIVPASISVELFESFPLVLLILVAAICCTREEDIIGVMCFKGKCDGGLGSNNGFGAWYSITSSLAFLSGTYFSGCLGFLLL